MFTHVICQCYSPSPVCLYWLYCKKKVAYRVGMVASQMRCTNKPLYIATLLCQCSR